MKINNFWGDLTNISAKQKPLRSSAEKLFQRRVADISLQVTRTILHFYYQNQYLLDQSITKKTFNLDLEKDSPV